MDLLADVFENLRTGGALYAVANLRAPWGMKFDRTPKAGFHAIVRGGCWLRTEERSLELRAGDFVLVAHGWSHALADSESRPALPYMETLARQRTGRARGERTQILCGAYTLAPDAPESLFRQLPPIVHVPASAVGAELTETVRRIAHEVGARALGFEAATSRLADLLLLYALRSWLAGQGPETRPWLAALRDPSVAKALAAIHDDVAHAWGVPELAQRAGVSRATLTRRFTALVGVAPMTYLARWRLTVAAKLLRETRESVGNVAMRVGYDSEFAFGRAFKRERGISPGQYRRRPPEKLERARKRAP